MRVSLEEGQVRGHVIVNYFRDMKYYIVLASNQQNLINVNDELIAETMYLQPHHHQGRGGHVRRLRSRSPSPSRGGRFSEHEVGFSEAVEDMVELVHNETSKRGRARRKLMGRGGEEFSLSPRFRPGYHDSALSPSTPDGANNGFLPPR